MSRRKLEAARARILELEREFGYAEPESVWDRAMREVREHNNALDMARKRQALKEARLSFLWVVYIVGLVFWPVVCFVRSHTGNPAMWKAHAWTLVVGSIWYVPFVVACVAAVWWFLTGRNLLERWL